MGSGPSRTRTGGRPARGRRCHRSGRLAVDACVRVAGRGTIGPLAADRDHPRTGRLGGARPSPGLRARRRLPGPHDHAAGRSGPAGGHGLRAVAAAGLGGRGLSGPRRRGSAALEVGQAALGRGPDAFLEVLGLRRRSCSSSSWSVAALTSLGQVAAHRLVDREDGERGGAGDLDGRRRGPPPAGSSSGTSLSHRPLANASSPVDAAARVEHVERHLLADERPAASPRGRSPGGSRGGRSWRRSGPRGPRPGSRGSRATPRPPPMAAPCTAATTGLRVENRRTASR